jgi:nucleoside 2-deoxyribosyltransferase
VCGGFDVAIEAWEDFLDPRSPVSSKLSALDRARMAHSVKTARTSGPSGLPSLTSDFLGRFIVDGCPGPSPADQAIKAITFIGDFVLKSGERLEKLPSDFYAAIGAPNPEFAARLAIELIERKLLSGIDASSMDGADLMDINLTLDGWERYEAERRGRIAGSYGFIAMQFGDRMLDPFVEDVVKPAIKEGISFDLVDMRNVARAGVIDNIMRAQIRDAAFVVVDLTHDNSGAYWEAGFAEGLGKPVIYICEKSKFDEAQTHFDTNHCTTVLWSNTETESFKQELVATLRRSLNLFPEAP